MPLDSKGTYRHNDQSARMHSSEREAKKDEILGGKKEEPREEEGGDEPIKEHLRSMHEEDGEAHSHVTHHFDGSHTSHHISDTGEESGPHEHENLEALKSHMDQFLDEEGHEPEREEGERNSEEDTFGDLTGSKALGM